MATPFDAYHKHPVIIGNIRIPMFFRFTQNPNNWRLQFQKEYQQTKTIGGYIFEHWGAKPATLSFDVHIKKDANLGNLIGFNTKTTNWGLEDPTFSYELITLQTLYNLDQRKLKGVTLSNSISEANKATAVLKDSFLSSSAKIEADIKSSSPTSIGSYINSFTDTIIYYKGCIYSGFFKSMRIDEDPREPYWHKVHVEFIITSTTLDWIDNILASTTAGNVILTVWGVSSSVMSVGSLLKDVIEGTHL